MLDRKQKHARWMILCIAGAIEFSTCTRKGYMSLILDNYEHVIGIGYNGGPKKMQHCLDGGCPRALTLPQPGSVYNDCIAIHAEANALLHSDYTARRDGGTIYINGTPCFDCAKLIANSGTKTLVFIRDESYIQFKETLEFLEQAGIELIELTEQDLSDF